MVNDTYDTLSAALNGLKTKGYVEDFNLKDSCIECKARNLQLYPANFIIDSYYRFEGASNPDDNSIVYAISSKDGLKGTLVDAYGVYSSNLNEEMIRKLKVARPSPSDHPPAPEPQVSRARRIRLTELPLMVASLLTSTTKSQYKNGWRLISWNGTLLIDTDLNRSIGISSTDVANPIKQFNIQGDPNPITHKNK